MIDNSGFASYVLYNALKLHFTTKQYDYFKYNGKTSATQESFLKRNDKYTFYKLSRKYSLEELQNFFVANFVDKDVHWVGELSNEDGEITYLQWRKRNQSLFYKFSTDLDILFEKVKNPDKLLMIRSGNFPILLQETMEGNIQVETLCILNDILNFLPFWEKKIDDDIIWPEWNRKIIKYTPFIDFDKNKYKNILKEKIKDYEER